MVLEGGSDKLGVNLPGFPVPELFVEGNLLGFCGI